MNDVAANAAEARNVDWAAPLKGPILVLGGGGFVGANLVQRLLQTRSDVIAVVRRLPAWRLVGLDSKNLIEVDLTSVAEMGQMVGAVRPRTVLDCTAYGAYPFETDPELIYRTNFNSLVALLELLDKNSLAAFVHAGSSSEYGSNSADPARRPRCCRTAIMPFPKPRPHFSSRMPAKRLASRS